MNHEPKNVYNLPFCISIVRQNYPVIDKTMKQLVSWKLTKHPENMEPVIQNQMEPNNLLLPHPVTYY